MENCKANRCCNGKNPMFIVYYGKPVCSKFWAKWGNRHGVDIRKRLGIKEPKRDDKNRKSELSNSETSRRPSGTSPPDRVPGDMARGTCNRNRDSKPLADFYDCLQKLDDMEEGKGGG